MYTINADRLLTLICDVKNQFDVDEIILTPIFHNFEKDCYLLSHFVYFIPFLSSGLSIPSVFLSIQGICTVGIVSVRQITERIYCECKICVMINDIIFFTSLLTTSMISFLYNIYWYWLLGIIPFIISWISEFHYTSPQYYLYFHSAWNIIIGFLFYYISK